MPTYSYVYELCAVTARTIIFIPSLDFRGGEIFNKIVVIATNSFLLVCIFTAGNRSGPLEIQLSRTTVCLAEELHITSSIASRILE